MMVAAILASGLGSRASDCQTVLMYIDTISLHVAQLGGQSASPCCTKQVDLLMTTNKL